ncbi:MAG: cytochrome c [Caldilineaceae bacterium]|nr:cytochrome c [Caldilineaceae bacterium]
MPSAGSPAPKLSLAVAEGEALATYDGQKLYLQSCAACHGQEGEGVSGLGAPFVSSELWSTSSDEEIVALVRAGIPADDPNNQTGIPMPPSGGRPDLGDAELLAIITFLRQSSAAN